MVALSGHLRIFGNYRSNHKSQRRQKLNPLLAQSPINDHRAPLLRQRTYSRPLHFPLPSFAAPLAAADVSGPRSHLVQSLK